MLRLQQKLKDGKRVHWRILASRVMAVAVEGGCSDWACYIGKVTTYGVDGAEQAYNDGNKTLESVARVLFSDFKDLAWRD